MRIGKKKYAGWRECPPLQSAGLSPTASRSEEHTSELQSPCNLVCRLLLEKKKKNIFSDTRYTRRKASNSSISQSPRHLALWTTVESASSTFSATAHACSVATHVFSAASIL